MFYLIGSIALLIVVYALLKHYRNSAKRFYDSELQYIHIQPRKFHEQI
jgi:hypothetical protein